MPDEPQHDEDVVEKFLANSPGLEVSNGDFETREGHRSGFVAVIGRPNVGKSTLINTILGQKIAIVSAKPQTTRIRQLGILTREDMQIIFVDTPGIHHPRTTLGEFMVGVAVQALRDADVILLLSDVSQPVTRQDKNIAPIINEAGDDLKLIRVLNKVDIAGQPEDYLQKLDAHLQLVTHTAWATTVATDGKGVNELLEMIAEQLPEGPRFYPADQVSDLWMRDIAAEMIREAALHLTEQEIPHAVAVGVDEYKKRANGVIFIAATLFVERDSQKPIIIGKRGSMIRQISTNARQGFEQFVKSKVYLDLHVKVLKNWRRDENALRRLGYRIEK